MNIAVTDSPTPTAEPVCVRCASLNPTRFLNAAEVRRFLLEHAASTRAHHFTRVSQETLVKINEVVRAAMIGHVKHLPSAGKTI